MWFFVCLPPIFNWLWIKLIFIWRYEQHKFELRWGRIFPTIISNKSDILELYCIFKFSNRKTHKNAINMFVFRMLMMIYSSFLCIIFCQYHETKFLCYFFFFKLTWICICHLFFLQNLSLFNICIYIYILLFFWVTLS